MPVTGILPWAMPGREALQKIELQKPHACD
jgi:hypothetical protein